jgi:hypothetical protein
MFNKKLIQWQQDVATKVIKPLHQMIDHTAILAGGAPRDWYYHKPARDLDYFISKDAFRVNWGNRGDNIRDLLCKVYNTKNISKLYDFGNYAPRDVFEQDKTNSVLAIYESTYKGLKIQFIVCDSTFTQINKFSMSLSKFWWHPDKPIVIPASKSLSGEHEVSCIHSELTCKEWDAYERNQVLVYDQTVLGRKYLKKIQEKYPYFKYITEEESEKLKQLRW